MNLIRQPVMSSFLAPCHPDPVGKGPATVVYLYGRNIGSQYRFAISVRNIGSRNRNVLSLGRYFTIQGRENEFIRSIALVILYFIRDIIIIIIAGTLTSALLN